MSFKLSKCKQWEAVYRQIKDATQEDRTLRALNAALKTGFWNVDRLKPYNSIKDEITFDHINHDQYQKMK